jgi:hypothetical protein
VSAQATPSGPLPVVSAPVSRTPSLAVQVVPRPVSTRTKGLAAVGIAGVVAVFVIVGVRLTTRPSESRPVAKTEKAMVRVAAPVPAPRQPEVAPTPPPPPPPPAVLSIHANVPNASFSVDGQPRAEGKGELRLELDDEGAHQVLVTAPHRQPFKTVVTVQRGSTTEVSAKLDRATAAAPGAGNGESKNYVLDPFHH